MDIFVEQLVKKQADGKSTAAKILVLAGVLVVVGASVFLLLTQFMIFGFLLICGACYGGYYLLSGFDCEYEYIVTNGEMDVDKIIAKRKRKRMITAKASLFQHFGKLSDAPEIDSGVTIVKVDGLSDESTEIYYADFTHSALGEVRLIFSPEQKVVDGLRPFLSRNTRIEFDRKYN